MDLNGGVSITYQTVEENPTAEQMSDTVYKLQMKAQSYSTEAQVYQEGKNRINIDIPGATDANEILAELGEPGTLQFADEDGNVLLTGDDVKTATAGMTNQNNNREYVIELHFTEAGATKFAEATKNNVGKRIFIIYNNEVISSPNVKEAITGGQASISPIESYEQAQKIASTIRIGALPVSLTELRSNVIGATFGCGSDFHLFAGCGYRYCIGYAFHALCLSYPRSCGIFGSFHVCGAGNGADAGL